MCAIHGFLRVDLCLKFCLIVQPNPFSSSICVYISAWKVSKCGVFSGTYFPALGLNTERYSRMLENTNQKNLRIWTLSRNVYIMYMYIYYTIYWELRAYQHSSDQMKIFKDHSVLKLLLELWALHIACGYPSWSSFYPS